MNVGTRKYTWLDGLYGGNKYHIATLPWNSTTRSTRRGFLSSSSYCTTNERLAGRNTFLLHLEAPGLRLRLYAYCMSPGTRRKPGRSDVARWGLCGTETRAGTRGSGGPPLVIVIVGWRWNQMYIVYN
ncbi:hypothetical protein RSAG8_13443, partial [Rhizoctonia solani AG-8 WAC10335]